MLYIILYIIIIISYTILFFSSVLSSLSHHSHLLNNYPPFSSHPILPSLPLPIFLFYSFPILLNPSLRNPSIYLLLSSSPLPSSVPFPSFPILSSPLPLFPSNTILPNTLLSHLSIQSIRVGSFISLFMFHQFREFWLVCDVVISIWLGLKF